MTLRKNMKKDIVMYKDGAFEDFRGIAHKFIVCALSTSFYNEDPDYSVVLATTDEMNGVGLDEITLPRAVFIGISVCNPGNGSTKVGDDWNEEKGKMIALAKAKGFKYDKPWKSAALFATRPGLISTELVEALLNKEVQHVIDDPESVIPGYNKMKADYERKLEDKKFLDGVSSEVLEIGSKLATMSEDDIANVVNVALIKSANE